jgi:hypothetical protein
VLSGDGQHIQGWVTGASVLHAIARRIRATGPQAPRGQPAAGRALPGLASAPQQPPMPLGGYQVLEITISHDSPASGKALGVISWPPGCTPVSVVHDRQLSDLDPGIVVNPGDRISLLVPRPPRPREIARQRAAPT